MQHIVDIERTKSLDIRDKAKAHGPVDLDKLIGPLFGELFAKMFDM